MKTARSPRREILAFVHIMFTALREVFGPFAQDAANRSWDAYLDMVRARTAAGEDTLGSGLGHRRLTCEPAGGTLIDLCRHRDLELMYREAERFFVRGGPHAGRNAVCLMYIVQRARTAVDKAQRDAFVVSGLSMPDADSHDTICAVARQIKAWIDAERSAASENRGVRNIQADPYITRGKETRRRSVRHRRYCVAIVSETVSTGEAVRS